MQILPSLLEEMRPRLWRVEPGVKLRYHYHNEQEELFYGVEGTGQMVISNDEEYVEIPKGEFITPGVRSRVRSRTTRTMTSSG